MQNFYCYRCGIHHVMGCLILKMFTPGAHNPRGKEVDASALCHTDGFTVDLKGHSTGLVKQCCEEQLLLALYTALYIFGSR